jgi:hypothetical protein
MSEKSNSNSIKKNGFVNDNQKKFFIISKIFKITNSAIVVIAIIFAAKYAFGV